TVSCWQWQLSTLHLMSPPAPAAAPCAEVHCGSKQECLMEDGKPVCSLQTKICSAWEDSYYRTFNGRDFVLQGNCNYTLHISIKFARYVAIKLLFADGEFHCLFLFLNSQINGQKRNLPLLLGDGSLYFHPSGSSVVLETTFGLTLYYDWRHHVQVEVGTELYGKLCGLCGNANHTDGDQTVDLTLPWVVNGDTGSCIEDCGGDGASCPVCTQSRTKSFPGTKGNSFMTGCTLLQWMDGPFASCHSSIDPEPFVRSCENNLCITNAATSVCKIYTDYATTCQRLGARVHNWRTMAECSMACPLNSHYEVCGSACPATCADPETHRNCTLHCVESCQCNRGFLLSGGKCVPHGECGCLHQGSYYLPKEKFWSCQSHCVCVGHDIVQCTNRCPKGTECTVRDGQRACYTSQPPQCTVMGGRHFRSYDGHNFDFNPGRCAYVLSHACDEEKSQLLTQQHKHNLSLWVIVIFIFQVDGVLKGLPVQLDHIVVLQSGLLTHVVVDTGVVITYGGPNLIHVVIPASNRKMCGLCGNISALDTDDKHSPDGSPASDVSIFASSWMLSPSGTNCSQECELCSVCNSSMATEFASDNFCGVLLASAGSFSGCHSTVDPKPFFKNCVSDLCMSNGNEGTFCRSLSEYTFACQEAGAEVKPWRGERCSLLCPENSYYNICVSACPQSCVTLSDFPCPWACYEGCQCDSGYMQSGNGCIKAEECGCFFHGQYYEIGERLWAEGCSEHCHCSATATMFCEPASCPEGESCTLNNTWGCSQPVQTQCLVLGGAHYYTFDGKMFEFQGNCTYTLMQVMNDTTGKDAFWVGIQKDRTPNDASSIKAIHVKVAKHSVVIYRGERGHVWVSINGEKKLLPLNLQFGSINIAQSGFFVVVDTSLGIQVKYDCSHFATIFLPNTTAVNGLCGNNNGIEEDDLRSPQGKAVDATTFGWHWRVPDQEAWCTADCGDACPRCSAEQLQEKNVARQWISFHEYIWSPQNPFYLCRDIVNYTKISTAVSIFDLCSSDDPQKTLCHIFEAYAAACQNAHIEVGEWRKSTNCSISCPLNSHFESCGTACPATCEARLNSNLCTLACVETCQCDSGFVLDGDICVPLSQCGCNHNGYHYHRNQTFWADERCTEKCFCDPHTHQTQCHVDSCGPDESCTLENGVRSCIFHPQQTCIYSGHHILTFDQHDYDLHGTCQYQVLGMCGNKQGLHAVQVHVQTDGHLESALHVLVNVSGVLVALNSKNMESLEVSVDGVIKNMPYHLGPTALAFSLGMHTYIYTDVGFEFSLSTEGVVNIQLSSRYANAVCGLCGNFNSDPADDLTASGAEEHLSHEHFGRAWRSGQNPWCVDDCLGGSCPKCSTERLAHFSDPEACGKILEVNGPFRHCHGKVNPSIFYKRCVSDLCLHGGLQPALCHSLAVYTSVCLSHRATVYAWRSPGFCSDSASVHLCLGLQNNTVEMPLNTGENCLCEAGLVHSGSQCVSAENCGCFHQGEYLQAGQEVSTCEKICRCNAGGRMTCRNTFCGKDEECKLLRGVQGCYPKPKLARCSVDGSQYTTFDGRAFEFHGSCNYTLVQTCALKKLDVKPVFIAALQNHSKGRQISLQVNKIIHKLYCILYLKNHILVKIPNIYHQTTCGLCGNYNDNPSDDLQLPDGSVIFEPEVFGPSWKLLDNKTSCSNVCDGTCQRCRSPMPEYTSDLYCGLLTHPKGPFSSCQHLVGPQKFYSLCMKNLCISQGQHWALCDALWDYEAACKEAGAMVDLWTNTTSCAHQCPQFSHYSQCANVCSSLCPEISQAVQCPGDCEKGCQCNFGHLYDGNACVPAEQCGCIQDGRRFKLLSIGLIAYNCPYSFFFFSQVNGQVKYVPVNLLQGKIQVSHKGTAQLKTDFGLHVVFGGNSTVVVTLSPCYKGQVYGLCGNFNGDHQDDMPVTMPGSPPSNSNAEFAQAYRLSDGDDTCSTGCKREPRVTIPADSVSEVAASNRRLCEVLKDKRGPKAYCHSLIAPDSFYESCLSILMQNGTLQAALDQAISSYSIICEASSDGYYSDIVDVHCPPNSHYKTCGTACPPSCEYNTIACTMACVMGCFCDPGFITSPTGCVRPHQCGCTESTGKYHSLNSTYWTPDNCGQLCTCGPATGEVHCQPAHCPRGMVCKQLHRKKMCQPEKPMNCTMVTGMHFTSFDGHHFDYRDSCSYSLVQTKSNVTELTPFTITISDAICHKRLFNSLNLSLSVYDLEVHFNVFCSFHWQVDGLHEPLPYSHPTGHVNAYRTPSSLVIHTDVGLQVVVYNSGTLMVILSRSYASSVSGLCANANSDPKDDLMMPDEEQAQNILEFVHSWRSRGAEACRDDCFSRLKHCPAETLKLFEGSDFCGVLLNELGPFADCSSVLNPKHYFHSCVVDVCSYSAHYSALCSSIASYAAACQAARLPVRHWRSDTFCREYMV
uniref:VWFD domain-containing protein n=1 Tax=Labrus bergylta TaxID=56723 RepID=A0A3Q3EKG2_9LABR